MANWETIIAVGAVLCVLFVINLFASHKRMLVTSAMDKERANTAYLERIEVARIGLQQTEARLKLGEGAMEMTGHLPKCGYCECGESERLKSRGKHGEKIREFQTKMVHDGWKPPEGWNG